MIKDKGIERFKEAQAGTYGIALKEVQEGCKASCWMWYIFPQLKGLGFTETSEYYGITGIEEAKEYLKDESLGKNLRQITEAAMETESHDALDVFGYPDDLKLCSCMTLFYHAAESREDRELFKGVIDKFFGGNFDPLTEGLLAGRPLDR